MAGTRFVVTEHADLATPRAPVSSQIRPAAKTATVLSTATGVVFTLSRLLGSTSQLALVTGSSANLKLDAATGAISATAPLGVGVSQKALVRENDGDVAVEYPVTITGVASIIIPVPTPTVLISAAQSKSEGNSGSTSFVYTVTRSAAIGAVSVPWSFAANTTSANDFVGGSYPQGGTVELADGVSSGTFTVSVSGDTTVEFDESFSVSIATPAGYAAGTTTTATGTILNDDVAPSPTVTISAAQSKSEGNSGATVFTYTVTRSAADNAAAVPWSFTAGTTSADDFTGGTYPTGGTVNMAAGVASATFWISVNGDTVVEGDETFTVFISTPSGYVAGAATSATGTILNDDVAPSPTVTISAAQSKSEGNSGAIVFTYTVTRSAYDSTTAVPWSFAPGTTTADDFTGGTYPTGGTVNMAAGVASGSFSVSINGDTVVETDETFTVSISPPSGYIAGAATSATGTIMNDDVAPSATVMISAAQSKSEGNSGATLFTYTVTRSASSGAVAVPWAFTAGTTSADDFTGGAYPAGGTVNMADGVATGTFTVSVAGDTVVEGDETFTVLISTPSGYVAGSATSATGTILNDDTAGLPALQVVTSRNFFHGEGVATTSSNNMDACRLPFTTGNAPVSSIAFVYSTYYGQNVKGPGYLLRAHIEYNGIVVVLTFDGATSRQLVSGEMDVRSDEIPASAFGLTQFPPNFTGFEVTEREWVAGTNRINIGTPLSNVAGFGCVRGPIGSPSKIGVAGAFNNSNTTWADYSARFFGPTLIVGRPVGLMPAWITLGASIEAGTADDANRGYAVRSAQIAPQYAQGNLARGGETSSGYLSSDGDSRRALYKYFNCAINGYLGNDYSGGTAKETAATNMATINAQLKAAGIKRILQVRMAPKSDTTDAYVTTANQTVRTINGGFNVYRNYIDAQALLDPNVNGIIDMTSVQEPANDSGKWAVNGTANYATADGTHPSTAMHILMVQPCRTAIDQQNAQFTTVAPFSAQSPWNSYPDTPVFGTNTVPDGNTSWIEESAYSTKPFYALATDTPVTIYGTDGGATIDISNQLEKGTVTIPRFPTATSPAVGSDGHCEIVDMIDGVVHSFYQMYQTNGQWRTNKYAKSSLYGLGFGSVHRPDNVRAAGCSTLGGLLLKSELGLKIVPHALAMSMDRNAFVSGPVAPATLEDYTGYSNYGNIAGKNFPMGALLGLPASFDAEALALPESRTIARTLKKYGAYLVDATVGSMNFYAEIGSGWNKSYVNGQYDNNFSTDMAAIKAAIRRVTSFTTMRDRDGVAYTPTAQKNMNLLSMRGPWTGEYGSPLDGKYDATTDLYTIAATTETRTLRELMFTHSETEPNRFFLWKGQNSWNRNPEPGATYKLTAVGTGNIQVTMNVKKGDFSTSYGTTGKLSPGASATFTWPNTTDTVTEVYIDKAVGAAASIRLELVRVV